MSNKASGSFFVGMIMDGDSVSGRLYTTAPLAQMYKKGTAEFIPNWTTESLQPIIYPIARSANENTIKGLVSDTDVWLYNGQVVSFNASNISATPSVIAGKLKRVTYNNGSVNVPALRIVGNLAGESNLDNDIITLRASVESSGHTLTFESSIDLKISEYTDSEYNGFLNVTNGGIIDQEGETIVVTPELWKGGSKMTNGFTVEWLKPPYSSAFSTAATVTIGRGDIDSRLNLMCRFKVNNVVVYTELVTLSDEIDPYFIRCDRSGTNMLASAGVNSQVTFTYKLCKQGTGAEVSGINMTYATTLTGANGQVVTPATTPTNTGCTITYNDVKGAGGNITGAVTGTEV